MCALKFNEKQKHLRLFFQSFDEQKKANFTAVRFSYLRSSQSSYLVIELLQKVFFRQKYALKQ